VGLPESPGFLVVCAGDKFRISVSGRNDKLKKRAFAAVADRGGSKTQISQIMHDLRSSIQEKIDEVMEQSQLSREQSKGYREAVLANIRSSVG